MPWMINYDAVSVHESDRGELADEWSAWEKLHVEIEASISLGTRERRRLAERLSAVTKEIADDAERLLLAKERHRLALSLRPPQVRDPEGGNAK